MFKEVIYWLSSAPPSRGMNNHMPVRVLDPLAIGAAGVSVTHLLPALLSEGAATLSIVWLGLQMYVWIRDKKWRRP